jgi:alpha-ketoglutarate-dependent taurine dioxygenase
MGPDAGKVAVPAEVEAELDAFVATLDRNPVPLLLLRLEDFELDATRRFMRVVKDRIDTGLGFAIVDRLPVDRWSESGSRAVWWLLASMVSRPVAQKWDGTSYYDVYDRGIPIGDGVRPDTTNNDQNYHTDNSFGCIPPDYVGLFCLRTAMEGGISGLVSFATVHEEMRRRHPELLARLYRPFHFDRQYEHPAGEERTILHPMFERHGSRLAARLSLYHLRNGYRVSGLAMDAEGKAATDAFEEILATPGLGANFHFEPGQIQLVDNLAIGHKRTGFRDWPEPDRKRLLIRLWLRDRGSRAYNG